MSNKNRVYKYRKNLRKSLTTYQKTWEICGDTFLEEYFQGAGIDKFRIAKKHNFKITSPAYIYELALFMSKKHKKPIETYIKKLEEEVNGTN